MFKKLFGSLLSGSGVKAAKQHESYDYSGFVVTPCPKSVDNGWRAEAMIEKTIDGEVKRHHFIRSDVAGSEAAALDLIANKVKVCIDQQGDRVFS
ncbi:MAG: hypothetical protein ACI9J2_002368 [Saprospiraceae bacterium]|jgi:hypothetical protein